MSTSPPAADGAPAGSATEPVADPEAQFTVADPGKEWRRGRGIPVVPAFDGYRAVSILGVVLFHVFQVSGVFASLGKSGWGVLCWGLLPRTLDALFIVSGFVIYLPTVVRGGDFGRVSAFAIRRAARLVPAYWICLGISLILLATVAPPTGVPGLGPIVTHLAVLQTPALLVSPHYPLGLGVIAPVWTLSVEVGFYIVLPLVAAWYFRRPFIGLAAAAAIVVVWQLAASDSGGTAGMLGIDLSEAAESRIDLYYASQFPSWAFALAAGMTAAWAYVRLRDRWSPNILARYALRGTVVSAFVLAFFIYLAGHDAVNDPQPLNGLFARQSLVVAVGYPAALATTLLALALAPGWVQRPVTNRPIRWVADISYGIYLIHFAVIWFALQEFSLAQDGSIGAAAAWAALVGPTSIAYAYLSARLVERPVRRWAHRFGRRAQAPGEAPAPA